MPRTKRGGYVDRSLVRKVLYPAYRALKRDSVLTRLAEMRRVQAMEPDAIREYQWEKLRTILTYAAKHVPYYRDMFDRLGAAPEDIKCETDLGRLPIVRKRDIRANPEAFVSDCYPGKHLTQNSTGGSTGENLYFRVGREAREAGSANAVRMNEWIDISIGDKVAMLWGTAFDVKRTRRLTNALKIWLSNQIILSAYSMDESSMEEYVRRLDRFKPDLVAGYPSAMAHFAQAITGAGAEVHRPKAVVLSGETLFQWQREAIETAFRAPVYNHYGCREFGAVARECKSRHGLHIACERLLLEVQPSDLAGEDPNAGEIIITDLDSFGMPFIRYAIEDLGSITWDKCGCGLGLPRLVTTIGRTFDVVRAPNGNALGGTFWTILLRSRKGIERFQVIQEELAKITVAITPTTEFSDETRQYILNKVREACGPEMRVRFELKPHLESTPTGKHRFVISRLSTGHAGGEDDSQA
jgi:phenylacetate-CoA ligase